MYEYSVAVLQYKALKAVHSKYERMGHQHIVTMPVSCQDVRGRDVGEEAADVVLQTINAVLVSPVNDLWFRGTT
jgi:hypothetical protein